MYKTKQILRETETLKQPKNHSNDNKQIQVLFYGCANL